jgi:hypothetical protein
MQSSSVLRPAIYLVAFPSEDVQPQLGRLIFQQRRGIPAAARLAMGREKGKS